MTVPSIFDLWEITPDELSQALVENGSLRGMVFGYVAEIKLRRLLQADARVTATTKDDDHDRKKKGDLRIVYRGIEFKIESKSLQTSQNKRLADGTYVGGAQCDASDKRTVTLPNGTTLQTTNLLIAEFDVLAVNCFTFEKKWHWVFARNDALPRSTHARYSEYERSQLLATMVPVTWPASGYLSDNVFKVLDELVAERAAGKPHPVVEETATGLEVKEKA
jgi:hypothetical protein